MPECRFPPPWSVDDPDMKLGQDFYFEGVQGPRSSPSRSRLDATGGVRPRHTAYRLPTICDQDQSEGGLM
jgi:hypothetical protein